MRPTAAKGLVASTAGERPHPDEHAHDHGGRQEREAEETAPVEHAVDEVQAGPADHDHDAMLTTPIDRAAPRGTLWVGSGTRVYDHRQHAADEELADASVRAVVEAVEARAPLVEHEHQCRRRDGAEREHRADRPSATAPSAAGRGAASGMKT